MGRRPRSGADSHSQAIEAAGGLYIVSGEADRVEARASVLAGRIRALEVQIADLDFLEGLPLEFLTLNVTDPQIEPVNSLRGLRGLGVDSWRGALDLAALPALEWFGVTEVAAGQLDALAAVGHARLRHISIGRYRWSDLRPLERLSSLERLEIVDSRALERLDGIENLSRLRALELATCPGLGSLDGLERATGLDGLVVASCNRVADLVPIARGGSVRALMLELPKPPSLLPLLDAPALEILWLVGGKKRPDAEFDALRAMATLTYIQDSRRCWLRDRGQPWTAIPDVYAATPALGDRIAAGQDRFRAITLA